MAILPVSVPCQFLKRMASFFPYTDILDTFFQSCVGLSLNNKQRGTRSFSKTCPKSRKCIRERLNFDNRRVYHVRQVTQPIWVHWTKMVFSVSFLCFVIFWRLNLQGLSRQEQCEPNVWALYNHLQATVNRAFKTTF